MKDFTPEELVCCQIDDILNNKEKFVLIKQIIIKEKFISFPSSYTTTLSFQPKTFLFRGGEFCHFVNKRTIFIFNTEICYNAVFNLQATVSEFVYFIFHDAVFTSKEA